MIQGVGSGTQSIASAVGSTDMASQQVFLNLLITQLKNQDPLQPMEGTEFVTQLAQFTQLDTMREVSTGVGDLKSYMASLNNFGAVALIGRTVEFAGDEISHAEGTSSDLGFTLSSDAAGVTLKIYDEQGKVVRTCSLGAMSAGKQSATWDGKDEYGQNVPAGGYRFEVEAEGSSGQTVTAASIQKGRVEKVEFRNGSPYLQVGGQWIGLGEIYGIGVDLAA
ncbi:MAG: flagellar hook assembly protein FlgD [bacterium]